MLNRLGLAYNVIHVCVKGCMFANHCVKCGETKYKVHNKFVVRRKVFRHFPIIRWLRMMYNTLVQIEFMTWHAQNKNIDGMVRHAIDFFKWKFVHERWFEFAMEPRNVRLGLAIDGVNLFSEKQSTWSTWLVVLFNYTIPPWHTT